LGKDILVQRKTGENTKIWWRPKRMNCELMETFKYRSVCSYDRRYSHDGQSTVTKNETVDEMLVTVSPSGRTGS